VLANKQPTIPDSSANGLRSTSTELVSVALTPRQRLDLKKNGSHIIREEQKEGGMAIKSLSSIGKMTDKK
jgi:hypothetical protein